jgi:hypothetical protein
VSRTKEQTLDICLEAIKQNSKALEFVKEQTSEICFEAMKQNPAAIKFIKIFDYNNYDEEYELD